VLQWDQPYVTGAAGSPGASSMLDLCVTGSGTDQIINVNTGAQVTCTGANSTGVDPVQILIVDNPANAATATAAEAVTIQVGLAGNTAAPGRIKLAVEGGGLPITFGGNVQTASPTLQGHPGANGAATVGAAAFYDTTRCSGTSPSVLEPYSSRGGTPILFDKNGTRLATQIVRQKPNFVGPDGGNDTFLGFQIQASRDTSTIPQCANHATFPNFFGTSAASPHAAALAALMLQANPTLTPTQIYGAIQTSAAPMPVGGGSTPDYNSGYGFIQADAAMALIPPGPPTLTLASTTVAPGASTTLTWTSINATTCTASGGWTGTQNPNGNMSVTGPSTTGTVTYQLTCSNANGTSAAGTATLQVADPSSSGGGGGGGGALDEIALGVLAAIAAMSLWAPARRRYLRSCRATIASRHR